MDPTNPDVVYASMWQRIRRKWSDPRVEPGYDEGGIFKTTDGGRTWAEASAGLPAPEHRGRIGIDISLSNPKVLYALVDNYEPGRPAREGERDAYRRPVSEPRIKAAEIYRTDDAGKSWRKVSESNDTMISRHSGTYGWVFGQIRVDPRDENTIYSLGINLYISKDAGKTMTVIARQIHRMMMAPMEAETSVRPQAKSSSPSRATRTPWVCSPRSRAWTVDAVNGSRRSGARSATSCPGRTGAPSRRAARSRSRTPARGRCRRCAA